MTKFAVSLRRKRVCRKVKRWENDDGWRAYPQGDAIYGKAFITRFVLDVLEPEKFHM